MSISRLSTALNFNHWLLAYEKYIPSFQMAMLLNNFEPSALI
jgi:hypothetical protein